jgi:hypothetical protein
MRLWPQSSQRSTCPPSAAERDCSIADLDLAEISVFEQIAGQPAGARGDHDGVRLGQGLEASGEIGRIAGDIVLDHLAADDNQPGGNPDPRVELFGLVQLQHPIDQRQPASRSALGVVLVRLRIAEIHQHAVAHVAGDKPAKALDNLCDAAMVGADDPAQILGIEPRRQGRRADQIAEHYGQLPAFSVRSHWCLGRGRRRGAEGLDGVEQAPTVPDQDNTEVFQVLGGQVSQHRAVDRVLSKRGLVLGKAEAA